MSLLFKNKLKIKTTVEQGKVKTCISYYKVKGADSIKLRFLATMNTAMMYQTENKYKETTVSTLINSLDMLNVNYCKKSVTKNEVMKIFGIASNLNNIPKTKEYSIGIALNSDNLEAILKSYDLHYYISKKSFHPEELLKLFEDNFLNEEDLTSNFNYDIFDSNSIEQIVIIAAKEDSDFISNAIRNITK
jgi:hypothetical protein